MKPHHQLPLYLPLQPNYASTDFIQSSCNAEALRWIQRWPEWPLKFSAIYGETRCGKTHLAHIWQEKSEAYFLTLQDIQHISPAEIIKNYQTFGIDNADSLFSAKDIQEQDYREKWLFHFYNLAQEKGAYCLIFGLQPPTQWNLRLPDLRSRLSTVLSIAVYAPDEEALRTILFKLSSERGLSISSESADYILRRIERSFEKVCTVIEAIDQHSLSTHRQPTTGLIREVLDHL